VANVIPIYTKEGKVKIMNNTLTFVSAKMLETVIKDMTAKYVESIDGA